MTSKRKVAYFYDPDIGNYYYGPGHPMKPHRIRMTHSLILHYGLHNMMDLFIPAPAEAEDLVQFHDSDYIAFLRTVNPDNQDHFVKQMKKFNVGEDCPVFNGLFKYCQSYTGGSVGGAVKLNHGNADLVINWSGGLHHAKKAEASGFCYVNDIVLAILELLKYHRRVLYVDIDVHHGDGVEEAFLTTDRVLTCSFHKFGDSFFPGTGDVVNVGHGPGKMYALNAPLESGITDEAYKRLFQPVMRKAVEVFQPEAIVFQSGADSLAGDRIGLLNLSIVGHAECVKFMQTFNLPMLVLGGGGYKINNVARCWAYETGAILGVQMADQLPDNEYRDYYGPSFRLVVPPNGDMQNENTGTYLDALCKRLLHNLSQMGSPNSVPFHERPPDYPLPDSPTQGPGDPHRVHRLWDGQHHGGDKDDRDLPAGVLRRESGGRARVDISGQEGDGEPRHPSAASAGPTPVQSMLRSPSSGVPNGVDKSALPAGTGLPPQGNAPPGPTPPPPI
ncbi:hypothetical protein WJX73_008018 [Symbiochloris irregularis]|uniref:histone deacetylase n=1 Tax=Symbiochloris irregularis TaxID=706552 RepID=A0AAW1Q217_9CHLO